MIYQSRARTARLLLLSLAMASVGIYVITVHTILRRWTFTNAVFDVIGIVGFVFGITCAGLYAIRLLSRKPLVEVDGTGIVDNASILAVGRILWSDVRAVRIISVAQQEFLSIWITDERRIDRRSTIVRLGMCLNRRFGWGTANIPQSILPLPLGDLVDRINAYRGRQSGQRSDSKRSGEPDLPLIAGDLYEGAEGRTLLLQITSDEGMRFLHSLFARLADSEPQAVVRLDQQPGVVLHGEVELFLVVGSKPASRHLVVHSTRTITWSCSAEEWSTTAELLEPFLDGSPGHQYLTSPPYDDLTVLLSFKERLGDPL